jgi:hypothetical protein
VEAMTMTEMENAKVAAPVTLLVHLVQLLLLRPRLGLVRSAQLLEAMPMALAWRNGPTEPQTKISNAGSFYW